MNLQPLIGKQARTASPVFILFNTVLFLLLYGTRPSFSQTPQAQFFWSSDKENDQAASTLGRIAPDGSNRQTLLSGIRSWGIAADYTRGHLYWTDYQKGTIERANTDGSARQVLATGQASPAGIAYDPVNEKIYWVNYGNGTVFRANPDGTGKQNITPQTSYVGLSTIALDIARGKMYLGDYISGRIDRTNLDGTGRELFYTNPPDYISGLALDDKTEWLYWTDRLGGTIKRKATYGGSLIETLVTGQAGQFGFGLVYYQSKLYWTNASENTLRQANPDGSGPKLIAGNLSAITGLALYSPNRHFAGASTLQVPGNLVNMVVKDITGDTHLDIVGNSATIQNPSEQFYFLPGNGQGTFSAALTRPITRGYQVQDVGDVTRDNLPDLLAHYYPDNGMRLFSGTGNNSFSAGTAYPAGIHARVSRLADINKDGLLDIIHLSTGSGQPNVLHIFKGQANGTFAARQFYPSQSTSAVDMEIVDFNGDGRPDVAAKMEGTDVACLFLQGANGSFSAGNVINAPNAESTVTFGDMDGDNLPDMAVADYKAGLVTVYTGNGNGTFYPVPMRWIYLSGAFRPQIKDVNGDQLNDLVVAQTNDGAFTNGLAVFLGNGYGSVQLADVLKTNPALNFSVTDVNKDNRPDLLIAHANRTVSVYINGRQGTTLEVYPDVLPEATLGTDYEQRLTVSGGQAPYQFTLKGSLPAGFTFERGILAGTPTAAGSTSFTVEVRDERGNIGTRQYTLSIEAIIINPVTLPEGKSAESYTHTLHPAGAPSTTYTLTSGSLPTGITLNGSTGTLSGIPQATGTFRFSIQAAGNQLIQPYVLVITCGQLSINNELPDGITGEWYTENLSASGGLVPYTYTVSSGNLPPGLTLNPGTGLLSGTLTTTGSFTFTVQVTDRISCSGTKNFTVTSVARPLAPVITTVQDPDLGVVILTSSAAEGNQWYKDGEPIPGATSATFHAVEAGTYTVKVTVNGVSSVSDPFVLTVTGIEPGDPVEKGLQVYPNPATEYIVLTYLGSDLSAGARVYIYDGQGQQIQELPFKKQNGIWQSTIDTRLYQAGIFTLMVESKKQKYKKRFIKF